MSRLLVLIGALLAAASDPPAAAAQMLPPPPDERPVTGTRPRIATAGWTAGPCSLIPLWFNATIDDTKQFYAKASGISPMEQAKFIGWKNQKTVSVDWLTGYLTPFRFTAGTTVTDTRETDEDTDTKKPEPDHQSDDALAHLAGGGDIYVTAAFPVAACLPAATPSGAIGRFYLFALPRLALVSPALGAATPTEVTERAWDIGIELYGDYGSREVKVFAQSRFARQNVSAGFARSLRLADDTTDFALNQLAIGLQLFAFRISWYKVLSGPDVPFAEYKAGKLLLQIAPYTF